VVVCVVVCVAVGVRVRRRGVGCLLATLQFAAFAADESLQLRLRVGFGPTHDLTVPISRDKLTIVVGCIVKTLP
jgi:hypothetical protein